MEAENYDWPPYEPADDPELSIIQKWNEKHIRKWLNRHEAPRHSTSLIDHFATNSHSSLAITEAGELIFGRDEGLGLCITCEHDPEFILTTRKFRFFYDLFLEYEMSGYKIEEYRLDDSPFHCTIPSSKHPSRSEATTEAATEPTENTHDMDSVWNHISSTQRPAMTSEKRRRLKTAHQRRHCLGTGRLVKLRRRREFMVRQRVRAAVIKRERSDKQWRLADQDDVNPTWLNCADFFAEPLDCSGSCFCGGDWDPMRAWAWTDDLPVWDGWNQGGWEDEEWEPVPPEAVSQSAILAAQSVGLFELVDDEEVGEGGLLAILGLN